MADRRPFWQTAALTAVTAVTTGATTYYLANDTASTHTAQQAVRVDVAWEWCQQMYGSMDARVGRLESVALQPTAPAPPVELTPPDELFGRDNPTRDRDEEGRMGERTPPVEDALTPAQPPTAQPPRAPRRAIPKQKRIPTPNAEDPAVQRYK